MSDSVTTIAPPSLRTRDWLALLRPGDWLILSAGIAATLGAFALTTRHAPVDRAVIRRDGVVVAEIMLAVHRQFAVSGPLGTTVIDIEPGRARVRADPSPRQLCVRQGWLDRANATALCLPNHISLSVLSGRDRHDSVGY